RGGDLLTQFGGAGAADRRQVPVEFLTGHPGAVVMDLDLQRGGVGDNRDPRLRRLLAAMLAVQLGATSDRVVRVLDHLPQENVGVSVEVLRKQLDQSL